MSLQQNVLPDSITQRLDDYWYGLRFSKLDVPVNNLIALKQNNTEVSSKVVDALELYLRLKGRDRDKVFHRTARRNIKYVIKNMWVRRTYSN